MDSNSTILMIVFLCTLLYRNVCCSNNIIRFLDDKIEDYGERQSFSGVANDDCDNISSPGFYDTWTTKSIETEVCIMVYEDYDCNQLGWSLKVLSPGARFDKEPKSYHKCNEKAGGSQLNVDIVKYRNDKHKNQDVLESYQHICSCVSIPEYILDMEEWSIRNNGNDFLAYFEPDCSEDKWKPTLIKAGNNLDAKQISVHRRPGGYKIMSIGPNPNSTYFKSSCKPNRKVAVTRNENLLFEKTLEELLVNKLKPFNEFMEKQKLENMYVLKRLNEMKQVDQLQKVNNTHSNTTKDITTISTQLPVRIRMTYNAKHIFV